MSNVVQKAAPCCKCVIITNVSLYPDSLLSIVFSIHYLRFASSLMMLVLIYAFLLIFRLRPIDLFSGAGLMLFIYISVFILLIYAVSHKNEATYFCTQTVC